MFFRTENFMLEAFLDGDSYSSVADKRRFSTIDNQLNRVSEVIGDGITEGWDLESNSVNTLIIKSGSGLINKFYVETANDQTFNVDSNSVLNVFAKQKSGITGGPGPSSDVKTIQYTDNDAPAPVSGLSVEITTSSTVQLSWTQNTEDDLSHYLIYKSSNNVDFVLLHQSNKEDESYVDEDVDEGETYYYRVYAVDYSSNNSTLSSISIAVPISDTLPPNPASITYAIGDNSVHLFWSRPSAFDFDKIDYWKITSYQLNTDDTVVENSDSYVIVNRELYDQRIDNLSNGQTYKLIVQTVDTLGRISTGFETKLTPLNSIGPADPENITYTSNQSNSGVALTLSWQTGDSPYISEITYRYRIYLTVGNNAQSRAIDVPIGRTTHAVSLFTLDGITYSSITENTLVTVRITSLDIGGFESFGNYIRFVTSSHQITIPVENLTASFDYEKGQITAEWQNQSDTYGISISITQQDPTTPEVAPVSILNTTTNAINRYVLTDVELEMNYTITVTAINFLDVSSTPSTVNISSVIPDDLPLPEIPTEIEFQEKDRSITLRWSPPSNRLLNRYRIYRTLGEISLNAEDWDLIDTLPSTITQFKDYGLENNTTYSYYITCVDVYNREALHLPDDVVNLNFVETIPKPSGILTEVTEFTATLNGTSVVLTWATSTEEFDGFEIFRSTNNLHEWVKIGGTNKDTTQYIDDDFLQINGYTIYYRINKFFNDADIVVQTSSSKPENSIPLGVVTANGAGVLTISTDDRRNIYQLTDPITEYTNARLLLHKHRARNKYDPQQIDLNPELVIDDWETVDGRIFTTAETDISGTSFVLKVNDRIPTVFYTVDTVNRRIVFAEPIVELDPNTGNIIGDIPTIEMTVLGIEEVTGTLPGVFFDKLHAKQIQFGLISESQIPRLNHEGRIREPLISSNFLLGRYNNNTFNIDPSNTDTTKNMGEGTTFFCVAAADGDIATLLDFNQFDDGKVVGFNNPCSSIDTIENVNIDSCFAGVVSSESFLAGKKSYNISFEFTDNDEDRWVRIQTDSPQFKKNPVIDLNKKLIFRILSKSEKPFYLTLGVREILTEPAIGSNGGTSGPIEWVGVSEVILDGNDNPVPIGILIEPSIEWQTIEIDLKQVKSVSYEDGNDLLSTKFGTIEHIAITAGDGTGNIINFYLDTFYQANDKMVASTNFGLQVSDDFGSTWTPVRYTNTPVHKFYKSTINQYLWAITANEVLLATDVNYWFAASGTVGVQYIRDIVEDAGGNMYISTDKGVFRLDITLIDRYSAFRQVSPVTPYSNDCYALYHNDGGSGLDEILVSTDLEIYKTIDGGETWEYSGMSTAGFPVSTILRTSDEYYNLIAITKKHILRKLWSENDFSVLVNFEDDYQTLSLWDIRYFDGDIYVSTNKGLFTSVNFDVNSSSGIITFDNLFPQLTTADGTPKFIFGMDVVEIQDNKTLLFIGQENHLFSIDTNQSIRIKTIYINKDVPTFYRNQEQVYEKHIYNSFNNCVVFPLQVGANTVISCSYLPRVEFNCLSGGWAQNNTDAYVVIYKNGIPYWGDFDYDSNEILAQMNTLESKLNDLPELTSFNSVLPKAQELLDLALADITEINTGGENSTPKITPDTASKLISDLTLLLTYVDRDITADIEIPKFIRIGIPLSNRSDDSLSNALEDREGVELLDSTNIKIDTTNGIADFETLLSTTTDLDIRKILNFTKYDILEISIFHTNISNTGELTHREIEDKFELINTGLTSNLTKTFYDNLIKLGILIENKHNNLFDTYNVHNIQSRFYGAYTNEWYDIKNSTIDFSTVIETDSSVQPRFVNCVKTVYEDPYLNDTIWVATDNGIISYEVNEDGELTNNAAYIPVVGYTYISDIYITDDLIYVVATDKSTEKSRLFYTENLGQDWIEIETVNLPSKVYKIVIVSGIKIVSTSDGTYYCDNTFGTWYKSSVNLSTTMTDEESKTSFSKSIRNFFIDRIIVAESEQWFYVSAEGIEFLSIGRLTNNSSENVNCVHRFKNITYVGTDKGIYSDGNSVLSDTIQFGLEIINGSLLSSLKAVNDICHLDDALYCGTANGEIYRYTDEDINDNIGNEWKKYTLPDEEPIHKMHVVSNGNKQFLIVFSYNKFVTLDITIGSGIFG